MIKLILPKKENEKQVMDYKTEFENNNEVMHGASFLERYSNYDEWLKLLKDYESPDIMKTTGHVNGSTYLAIRECDNRMVGIINIRYSLNEYLFNFGGHIGYSVRKGERRQGYAKEMLRQALIKCKELNINKVLITCDKNNYASAKTIESNGGIKENEVSDGDKITERYWIYL